MTAAKVLRNGDGVVQVENGVVPPSGHEDRVAGVLHELVDLDSVPVLASYPRKQVHEVIDLRVTPSSIVVEAIKIYSYREELTRAAGYMQLSSTCVRWR